MSTASPDHTFKGHVVSVSPGTGAQFSILPPQNATGNWVKVVQRVPLRIAFDKDEDTLCCVPAYERVNVEIDTGHSRIPLMSAPLKDQPKANKMSPRFASMSPKVLRMLVTVCAMTATIMQALDTTIANVALPYMQGLAVGLARPDQLGAHLLHRRRRHHDGADRLGSPTASAARNCSSFASPASPSPRSCARWRRTSSRWCCSACCRAWRAPRWCRCRNRCCSIPIQSRNAAPPWRSGASA